MKTYSKLTKLLFVGLIVGLSLSVVSCKLPWEKGDDSSSGPTTPAWATINMAGNWTVTAYTPTKNTCAGVSNSVVTMTATMSQNLGYQDLYYLNLAFPAQGHVFTGTVIAGTGSLNLNRSLNGNTIEYIEGTASSNTIQGTKTFFGANNCQVVRPITASKK